jgi:hypothetical protein
MAGSFGYEAGTHYAVSIAAGERVLFPAVRAADPDTLIIADGFSCRSQIAGGTGRTALHLAEVLALAIREGEPGPLGGDVVKAARDGGAEAPGRTRLAVVGGTGAVAAAAAVGVAAWRAVRRAVRADHS